MHKLAFVEYDVTLWHTIGMKMKVKVSKSNPRAPRRKKQKSRFGSRLHRDSVIQ